MGMVKQEKENGERGGQEKLKAGKNTFRNCWREAKRRVLKEYKEEKWRETMKQ